MRPPKVTVIVPVYNAARWLPASFRSFERQTYANTEWVLVDDGSADSSAELCSSWCGRDPAHRRLVRKENGGASSARNVGLDAATGDYVLFWDSDDEQDPTTIEKMVEGVPCPGGVAVSSIRRVLPDGSHRDLFSCERHTMKPEGAVAAWLQGGGIFRSVLEARSACHACRERHQVRGGRHQRGCDVDRGGARGGKLRHLHRRAPLPLRRTRGQRDGLFRLEVLYCLRQLPQARGICPRAVPGA